VQHGGEGEHVEGIAAMRPHQCAGMLAGRIRGNRSDTDHGARSSPPSNPISPDPLQDGLPEDSRLVAGSASCRTSAISASLSPLPAPLPLVMTSMT
jgi:hypothetical protein